MNFGTLFSLGGAVIGLLTGGKSPLTIGGVSLDGFDSPEKIPWGGEQRVVVHEIPGGVQVFNSMGFYHRPIEIQGVLDGSSAVAKARQLEQIAKLGATTQLAWADFKRTVIVTTFEPDYTARGSKIPYRITCLVIPVDSAADAPGFLERLGKDVTDALGIGDIAPQLAQAQQYLGYARQALPVVGAIAPGLSAQIGGYLNAGGTALTGIQSAASGNLSGLALAGSAAGGLVGGPSPGSMSARLLSATNSAQALAASVNAASYVERAAKLNAAAPTVL